MADNQRVQAGFREVSVDESRMSVSVRHLTPDDVGLMEALLATFGDDFNEVETY